MEFTSPPSNPNFQPFCVYHKKCAFKWNLHHLQALLITGHFVPRHSISHKRHKKHYNSSAVIENNPRSSNYRVSLDTLRVGFGILGWGLCIQKTSCQNFHILRRTLFKNTNHKKLSASWKYSDFPYHIFRKILIAYGSCKSLNRSHISRRPSFSLRRFVKF